VLIVSVAVLGAVGGAARLVILGAVLLILGAIALVIGARWITFERYLE
jgi:hypothetical protein